MVVALATAAPPPNVYGLHGAGRFLDNYLQVHYLLSSGEAISEQTSCLRKPEQLTLQLQASQRLPILLIFGLQSASSSSSSLLRSSSPVETVSLISLLSSLLFFMLVPFGWALALLLSDSVSGVRFSLFLSA